MKGLDFSQLQSIASPKDFETAAFETFAFQYENNPVYRAYCDLINRPPGIIATTADLPFLPISLFKTHRILCDDKTVVDTFRSSGTTGQTPSQHFISDLSLYENSYMTHFQTLYGSPKEWVILALLPSYLERNDSSLVAMVEGLIRSSEQPESGFYLDDFDALSAQLQQLESRSQKTLLIGVSFALLDFAAHYPQSLKHTVIMETGGTKGRKKELVRSELHQTLSRALGVASIHSEYGMTELLSQAYAKKEGQFVSPPWMKVFIRDTTDPFATVGWGQTGGINIIDLANQNSCAFIATQDLGKKINEDLFEVLGRFDSAEIRGCNLMAGPAAI